MSGSLSNKANAEPNMTPILDMVFQLITFFMLVINFKSNMIDKAMELPVVGTARAVDDVEALQVMINLNKEQKFTVGGRVIEDDKVPDWIERTSRQSRMAERRIGRIKEDTDDLTTEVIIRCDKAIAFHKLNAILLELQKNGYRKFSYRAMDKKLEQRAKG